MDYTKATTVEDSAAQAEELEAKAKKEPDDGIYTHVFNKPFTHEGKTFNKLHFDFWGLTGTDSIAVHNDLLRRGITVVIEEYTPEYLVGMAARACTDRNEDGNRIVSTKTLEALPVRDFKRICSKMRSFFQRARFEEETSGSESNT